MSFDTKTYGFDTFIGPRTRLYQCSLAVWVFLAVSRFIDALNGPTIYDVFMIVLTVVMAGAAGRMAFSKQPVLSMGDRGFAMYKGPFVAWDEIERIELRPALWPWMGRFFDTTTVAFFPKDLAAIVERFPAAKRERVRASSQKGGTPLRVAQFVLPEKFETLVPVIERKSGLSVVDLHPARGPRPTFEL